MHRSKEASSAMASGADTTSDPENGDLQHLCEMTLRSV
jgi:hypothetical protein